MTDTHDESPIRYSDVTAARRRINGHTVVTAIREVESLGLSVKTENTQGTGSFKLRGATNVVLALDPAGVIAGSSGNHGTALSFAARKAGVKRTVIVLATDHSPHKRARIESLGAEIVVADGGNTARDLLAQQIAAEDGLEYVSSFNHPLVIAGQGTMALEILESRPNIKTIIAPVGGGGMISGIATAVHGAAPHVRVIGVEPVTADDTRRSLDAGRRVSIDPPDTICDGVRAQTPGSLTFPIIQNLVQDVITVSDDEVAEAMYHLWREGLTIEPSGALSVAGARRLGFGRDAVCVLSGGNITEDAHTRLIAPFMGGSQSSPGTLST